MLLAFGVLVCALVVLTIIARKVAAHNAHPLDERVRRAMQLRRANALDVATKPVTWLSMPLVVVTATAALVWWLHHIGRNNAALAIGLTPVVAAISVLLYQARFL